MPAFSDVLDQMDADVAAHVCDPALLRPAAGGADLVISAIVERPGEIETLQSGGIVRSKPVVQIPVLQLASLKAGDIVILPPVGGRGYKIAGAPKRPGDGRWWMADADDLGPLA